MLPYLGFCSDRCFFCSYFRHYIITINIVLSLNCQTRLQIADFIFLIFWCPFARSDAWYYILSLQEGLYDIRQTVIPVFPFIRRNASVDCCSTNFTPRFALYFLWCSKYDLKNFYCHIRRCWNILNSARNNAVTPFLKLTFSEWQCAD